MMSLTGPGCDTNLAAGQTSADCIISITEEVGYPDALFCTYFLVGSLTQLVDLHAQLILLGSLASLCEVYHNIGPHGLTELQPAGEWNVGL